MDLQIARRKITSLQSYNVKGFLFISGVDLRVQLIEWDKLLDFMVQNLIKQKIKKRKYPTMARFLSNKKTVSLNPKYGNNFILKAHKIRNAFGHDIKFDFEDPKQRKEILWAIEVFESTCVHIVTLCEMENWDTEAFPSYFPFLCCS